MPPPEIEARERIALSDWALMETLNRDPAVYMTLLEAGFSEEGARTVFTVAKDMDISKMKDSHYMSLIEFYIPLRLKKLKSLSHPSVLVGDKLSWAGSDVSASNAITMLVLDLKTTSELAAKIRERGGAIQSSK